MIFIRLVAIHVCKILMGRIDNHSLLIRTQSSLLNRAEVIRELYITGKSDPPQSLHYTKCIHGMHK